MRRIITERPLLKEFYPEEGFAECLRSFPSTTTTKGLHIHIWELQSATTAFCCWPLLATLLVQLEVKCHAQGHIELFEEGVSVTPSLFLNRFLQLVRAASLISSYCHPYLFMHVSFHSCLPSMSINQSETFGISCCRICRVSSSMQ